MVSADVLLSMIVVLYILAIDGTEEPDANLQACTVFFLKHKPHHTDNHNNGSGLAVHCLHLYSVSCIHFDNSRYSFVLKQWVAISGIDFISMALLQCIMHVYYPTPRLSSIVCCLYFCQESHIHFVPSFAATRDVGRGPKRKFDWRIKPKVGKPSRKLNEAIDACIERTPSRVLVCTRYFCGFA